MHGRLKVRTSEEEKERKKKEQLLKVKAYRAAMTKIQAKRLAKEYDDDLLNLTTQILLRNADVTMLWNIRRECIESKFEFLTGATADETKQAICCSELELTEQCLKSNPKSYSAWHHRCWALEHNPKPDWQKEVQLCDKYLKMDERNFHTWDYRRYVVSKAEVKPEDELNFCTEKIKVNFSNYSSWHYRSLLLPLLYPYDEKTDADVDAGLEISLPKRPMKEEKLQEELEMVITAAFTDPNDSSAWFYQRWLLGYSRAEMSVCAIRCDKEKALLCFTNPISINQAKVILCGNTDETLVELKEWKSSNQTNVDTIWIAAIPSEHFLNFEAAESKSLYLKMSIPTLPSVRLPLKVHSESFYYFDAPNRSFCYSASVISELRTQLDSCNMLLEYEPESKWTLLTTALIMHALDGEDFHSQSLKYLLTLESVDPLRKGYYKDLASQWILEKVLKDWSQSEDFPHKLNLEEQPRLNTICYKQYLCIADEILLGDKLKSSNVKSFKMIQP